ncbi:hypothetical protein D3C80_1731080 [compost metagenome]
MFLFFTGKDSSLLNHGIAYRSAAQETAALNRTVAVASFRAEVYRHPMLCSLAEVMQDV